MQHAEQYLMYSTPTIMHLALTGHTMAKIDYVVGLQRELLSSQPANKLLRLLACRELMDSREGLKAEVRGRNPSNSTYTHIAIPGRVVLPGRRRRSQVFGQATSVTI